MRYLVVLALLVAGCGEAPKPKPVEEQVAETAVERENRLIKYAIEVLPNNAKAVTDLGNGWMTFDLEMDGKSRRFLYRKRWYKTKSDYKVASECITELSEAHSDK